MSKNKAALLEALVPLEQALSSKAYLGGSQFSLADVVAIADLRAAFETVRYLVLVFFLQQAVLVFKVFCGVCRDCCVCTVSALLGQLTGMYFFCTS